MAVSVLIMATCGSIALGGAILRLLSPASSRRAAAGAACLCLGLGGLAGEGAAAWRDRTMRQELLARCRLLAAGLDRADLAAHRNQPSDIGEPWFMRIKERLTEARHADPSLVYVYLLEQTGDRIRFPNDDDPVTMPGYEPPGTPYDDAPAEMRQAVALGNAFALGPYRDRWGEFISVGAPIAIAPGRAMTVTLDVDAARWRGELWLWRAWPAMLGGAAAVIAVVLWSRGRALARARAAARAEEEANRAKDAYLATVSHDLRNPLSGIIGMTGLLADSDLTPQQREFVQLAHESGHQLLTLVNGLLDYARIEAGELEFDRVRVVLRDIVEDAVALLAPLATAKGVELDAIVDRGLPASLIGDPDRIRQLLHNLVGNAVKFTDEGEITVRVSGTADQATGRVRVTIAVRDTGVGIDASTLPRLFKPFSQGSEAGRRRGGTGLGLCIAQRIARAMGGDIAVDSAPRAGSIFTASMLLDPDPAPPELELVTPAHRGARVAIGIEHAALRDGLCELLAAIGLQPVQITDPDEAGRIAATPPVPAAAIIDAGWSRSAGPTLVAAGIPVATVATRNAGGTQVLASRRTPILLRPIRREGVLRLLANLWSERTSATTARVLRRATGRPTHASAPPPPEPDYAPSLARREDARDPMLPASPAAVDLLATGLRSGIEALREAVGGDDLAAIRRIALGLRSAAEPLRLGELVDACLALEAACTTGDRPAVRKIGIRLDGLRLQAQERLALLRRDLAG